MPTDLPRDGFNRVWRDLLVVLGVAWAVRALFITLVVHSAHSDDVNSWLIVAYALRGGMNPYATGALHWPPFAMMLVYGIDHTARAFGVSFLLVLRLVLIAAESLVTVLVYLVLTRYVPSRAARRLLLIGVSLNPIAVLLVCQHGNIDVFVSLCVVAGLCTLVAYSPSRDASVWLAACLTFGLGVFVKTVPLTLAPVLAPGARAATWLGRLLGLVLFVGPAALGLGVVYVLTPRAAFVHNVVHYRSLPGFFGISGLLKVFFGDGVIHRYERGWPWLAVVAMLVLFRAFWRRRRFDERQAALLIALTMAAIPALGPGYGSQYAYWFMPSFLVTYVLFDVRWRRVLLGWYVVAAATYLVEYAIYPFYGSYLVALFPGSGTLRSASQTSFFYSDRSWFDPTSRMLLDFPLFLAYLLVLVTGWRRLRLRCSGPDAPPAS